MKSETQNFYRVDYINLHLPTYNKLKANNSSINYMINEMGFDRTYTIYDIVMETLVEVCDSDLNHEQFIRDIEGLLKRELTHNDLVEYVQAITDYQN
tara:strand:+ start:33 stop:323 length:291 start_codon:yes stop_codon:yes gene_type:complete